MQNKFCLKAPSKTYKNLSHTKFKLFLLAAQIASANSQLRLLALSASRSNALLGLRRKMAAQRAKASLGRCQQTYSFYRTCVLFHIRIFMHSLCRRWSCVQFGVMCHTPWHGWRVFSNVYTVNYYRQRWSHKWPSHQRRLAFRLLWSFQRPRHELYDSFCCKQINQRSNWGAKPHTSFLIF